MHPSPDGAPEQNLFVRLPNHVGDACMCLPALDLLAGRSEDGHGAGRVGRALVLVGRPWAKALFAGHGWTVIGLPAGFIAQQRVLRAAVRAQPPRPEGVLFTNTFSTALHFALAGIAATGYDRSARRGLLQRAVAVPQAWSGPMHMVEYYHTLACAFSGSASAVPDRIRLRVGTEALHRARTLLDGAGVAAPFVMVCPVATGLHHGRVKAWSGFERLTRYVLQRGLPVLACPGPGERDAVRQAAPSARLLPETDLGTFAALLAASRLAIANDSGPGHLAAAVGAPLISLFGVTEPTKTRPWGPNVRQAGSERGWPEDRDVFAAVDAALDAG